MSHVGTPLCVSCVRGTAAGSPYAYRIPQLSGGTEGQALPQGPGSSPVGCYGETCSGGTRPTSCHTPIHGTRGAGPSFTLRPYVRAGAGFTMVQPPEAIIRVCRPHQALGHSSDQGKVAQRWGQTSGHRWPPASLLGHAQRPGGFLWSQVRCGRAGVSAQAFYCPAQCLQETGPSFLPEAGAKVDCPGP